MTYLPIVHQAPYTMPYESEEYRIPLIRLLPPDTRVWPVMGMHTNKLWPLGPVKLTRPFTATNMVPVPKTSKWSRFHMDVEYQLRYVMVLFDTPKGDITLNGALTYGFVALMHMDCISVTVSPYRRTQSK